MIHATENSGVPRLHWIDGIRGAALLLICFDHIAQFLPLFRSTLDRTFQLFGIVTMAEVFVLTSGATVARGYLWRATAPVPRERRQRLWKRGARIYLVHLFTLVVILTLSSLPGGRLIDLPAGVELHPFNSFALGTILLFQPRLADLLPMYVLFFFMLPAVLTGIERGKGRRIALASLLLWLIAQCFTLPLTERYFGGIIVPAFNPLAWQLLLVIGIFSVHPKVDPWIGALSPERRRAVSLLLGVTVLSFFLLRHVEPAMADPGSFWTTRPRLGALRMLNILAWLGFALFVAPSLRSVTPPGFLTLLGRHSLWIWVFNVLATYVWQYVFGYRYCGWSASAQVAVCAGTVLATLPIALLLDIGVAERKRHRDS